MEASLLGRPPVWEEVSTPCYGKARPDGVWALTSRYSQTVLGHKEQAAMTLQAWDCGLGRDHGIG